MNKTRYFQAYIKPDLTETGYFTTRIYFKVNKYPHMFQCLNWLITNFKPIMYVQGCSATEGFSIPEEITKQYFDKCIGTEWGGREIKAKVVEL